MWTNPQETANFVTFSEEIFDFIFCAVKHPRLSIANRT